MTVMCWSKHWTEVTKAALQEHSHSCTKTRTLLIQLPRISYKSLAILNIKQKHLVSNVTAALNAKYKHIQITRGRILWRINFGTNKENPKISFLNIYKQNLEKTTTKCATIWNLYAFDNNC